MAHQLLSKVKIRFHRDVDAVANTRVDQ